MRSGAILRRTLNLATVLLLSAMSVAKAGSESSAARRITDRVQEVAQYLERYALLDTSWGAQCDTLLSAWLTSVDSQARYGTADEINEWLAREDGRAYQAELETAVTNGSVVVSSVSPGSEAEKCGLKPGLVITAIDYAPVADADLERVRSWLQSFRNRPIVLSTLDAAGNAREFSVPVREWQRSPLNRVEELPTKIAYVKLNGLYRGADREVVASLARWGGSDGACSGMILDLRGAGGRDADAAAQLAGVFAPEGRVLGTIRDRRGNVIATYVASASFKPSVPVMVLLDETTRGASELCAALIKGLGSGALLIGRPTQGDPLVREPVGLSWGATMYIVTRSVVAADGSCYDGTNRVIPHIEVAPSDDSLYEPDASDEILVRMTDREQEDRRLRLRIGNDAVLRRAVELLQGFRALNVHAAAL